MTPPEAAALAELDALAAERSLEPAHGALRRAILEAVREHPDVDALEAARRLRAAYGPGGKAERRRIANLAGVLRAELERSTPIRPAAKGTRGKGATRAMTELGLRERATAVPGIPPGPELAVGWEAIRANLEANSPESAWHLYLEPLRLLGERTDRPGRTIVLEAPAGTIAHLRATTLKAVTAWAAETLGPVTVELVPEGSRIVEAAA